MDPDCPALPFIKRECAEACFRDVVETTVNDDALGVEEEFCNNFRGVVALCKMLFDDICPG